MSIAANTRTDLATTLSPNGLLGLSIYLEGGRLFYGVTRGGVSIIDPSAMGLKTEALEYYEGLAFVSTKLSSWNKTYTIPGGRKTHNVDNAVQREYVVHKDGHEMKIIVRVYDDGVAFRYWLPGPNAIVLEKEYTEFNMPAGTSGWGHPWVNTYEGYMEYYSAGEMVNVELSMPFLASIPNSEVWAIFTEANLYNANGTYCSSILSGGVGGHMGLKFAPDQSMYSDSMELALPFQTPFRAVIISDDLNELVNSTLVENVNPESKLDDTSWIKPGRAAWSWWSGDRFGGQDVAPNSKQVLFSLEQQKEYVDFAAAIGWEYVMVDAGWTRWPDGTVPELCAYAAEKGIGIFMWGSPYVHTPYGASRMNLRTWKSWGLAGVKIDMTQNDSQVGAVFLEETADYCAELGLMVLFHNATKPGGENRTWPNIIGSEAVLGLEHYMPYWPPAPTASHNCVLPFSRNVLGSMDYTPVGFSNKNHNTTQGHQLALSIVYECRIQNYADSIDIYGTWKGTELLREVPAAWEETRLLEGAPGEYVTMARRSGEDWYIGAITTDAKTVNISLAGLGLEEGDYTAYIYMDGPSMDFLDKEVATVNAQSTLAVDLLESGGCAVLVSKTTVPTMLADPYTIYEAEDATLVGPASVSDCANCYSGKKVSNMGFGGEVIFDVTAPATDSYKVRIYYLTADPRTLSCSVNDAPGFDLEIALGSGSWDVVRGFTTLLALNEGSNTIRLYHHEWAPDIDKIGVLIEP